MSQRRALRIFADCLELGSEAALAYLKTASIAEEDRTLAMSYLEQHRQLGDRFELSFGMSSARPSDVSAGQILCDRYELIDTLGIGGSADVFRARDLHTSEFVAVKMFTRASELFEIEQCSLLLSRSPRVARYLDEGFHADVPFLVTEFVHGARFPGDDPSNTRQLESVTAQVLHTVRYFERLGLTHGDLKPDNVLISHGTVKVLDLGISHGSATIDGGQALYGSPVYSAPERASGTLGPKNDLYSVGVMIREALDRVAKEQRSSASFVRLEKLAAELVKDYEGRPGASEALCRLESASEIRSSESVRLVGEERLFHVLSRTRNALELDSDVTRGPREKTSIQLWIDAGLATVSRRVGGTVEVSLRHEQVEEALLLQSLLDSRNENLLAEPVDQLLERSLRCRRRNEPLLARRIIREILRRCRQSESPEPAITYAALKGQLDEALADGGRPSLSDFMYELGRATLRQSDRAMLYGIGKAALLVIERDGSRALGWTTALGEAEESELERMRWTVHFAALRCTSHPDDASLARAMTRAAGEDARWRRLSEDWSAWSLYRAGRFADAAKTHRRAGELSTSTRDHLVSLLNACSADLEAGDFDRARTDAVRAIAIASEAAHSTHEARAEWILRAASYRSGREMEPDVRLVQASRGLSIPSLRGLIALTEAAVAWRLGETAQSIELADLSIDDWQRAGRPDALFLSRAFVRLLRNERPDSVALTEVPADSPPGIRLQSLALLRRSGASPDSSIAEEAKGLLLELRSYPTTARREILSLSECLSWIES